MRPVRPDRSLPVADGAGPSDRRTPRRRLFGRGREPIEVAIDAVAAAGRS